MANVYVLVINERTGDDCPGVEVTIVFSGWLRGWLKARTDADGIAELRDVTPGDAVIYVRGKSVYDGYVSGRVRVFV
ncbi:hypothetical protein FJZ36_13595 [Candidatus Poribacteria bacterium]|nr:hypothetical protein [Candidatus Poribacteria bacterium]